MAERFFVGYISRVKSFSHGMHISEKWQQYEHFLVSLLHCYHLWLCYAANKIIFAALQLLELTTNAAAHALSWLTRAKQAARQGDMS